MAQVLHGSAKTTHAIRAEIQRSTASIRTLSQKFGINPKTVVKWRKRGSVEDQRTGPKNPRSTVLSIEEEAMAVTFRQYTLLPLDDCLEALQTAIPKLTRSSLHRLLQRHGISQLPRGTIGKSTGLQQYSIGYFHMNIAELRTEDGKLYIFMAIDRVTKFACVELHDKATRQVAADFLEHLIAAVPYKIEKVLTDHGTHFTTPGKQRWNATEVKAAIADGNISRVHPFELAIFRNNIDHRVTRPHHPWTSDQVEQMNRTIKQANVRRHHYEDHECLRTHLGLFLQAYNFGKRLKVLKGLTPFEAICKAWQNEPQRFTVDPHQHFPRPNT